MKFQFRLQKLLDYRSQLKVKARQDYELALSHVQKAKNELKEVTDSISQTYNYIGGLIDEGESRRAFVSQAEAYIRGQKSKVGLLQNRINDLQLVAEDKKQILVNKALEEKVLEKLRTRSFEAFQKQEAKREAKRVDDLVIMSQGRRSK